jgi:hypothetical protein
VARGSGNREPPPHAPVARVLAPAATPPIPWRHPTPIDALAAQATTLISSTSAERMRSNLSAVNEKLSVFETAALTHLREKIFKPAGTQSWEGVEIASYWRKAGPALMSERLYKKRRI